MGKKILLIGTHGQYNWGDDLLLETFLRKLGRENEYFINSYDPAGTKKTVGDFKAATFHTTKDRMALLKYVLAADVIFFAGGTILRELYSTTGRNRYSSLLMVCALAVFAKKIARKRILMSNIGIGPIETATGKRIARIALDNADFVSLRDKQSYDLARAVSTRNKNLVVVPDAIFSREKSDFLPAGISRMTARRDSGAHRQKLVLGLNLNFDIANPSNWSHFTNNLAHSIKSLSERFDLEIRGIPMQTSFNPHNDIVTLREFRKLIPDIEFKEAIPLKPGDIGAEIALCDVLVAERLHALVIACIVQTPFVALEYDVKIKSLVHRLGMQDYGIDINEPFGRDDIADLAVRARASDTLIKKSLEASAGAYKRELDDYFETLRASYIHRA